MGALARRVKVRLSPWMIRMRRVAMMMRLFNMWCWMPIPRKVIMSHCKMKMMTMPFWMVMRKIMNCMASQRSQPKAVIRRERVGSNFKKYVFCIELLSKLYSEIYCFESIFFSFCDVSTIYFALFYILLPIMLIYIMSLYYSPAYIIIIIAVFVLLIAYIFGFVFLHFVQNI